MNIVLFEAHELDKPLPMSDARAQHIAQVLRRQVGDSFDAGCIDGPKGKAVLKSIDQGGLSLAFEWGGEEPELYPLDLIVGLSRPQTNRKILQEATALGVRGMAFVRTERGEPSYATSKLWTTGEWRRHLVDGAAQAFSTRLPELRHGETLAEAVGRLPPEGSTRIALDNYEATMGLGLACDGRKSLCLAIGSERGWTQAERALLRENGFALAHLGERVLRTETATVAAVSIGLERLRGGL